MYAPDAFLSQSQVSDAHFAGTPRRCDRLDTLVHMLAAWDEH